MTRYKVWAENTEQHTTYHKNWTERELLEAYNTETTCEPHALKIFQTEREALNYYNNLTPIPPAEASVSVGRVITYEVIGLDEEQVEDGEVIDSSTIYLKASPLVYEEG